MFCFGYFRDVLFACLRFLLTVMLRLLGVVFYSGRWLTGGFGGLAGPLGLVVWVAFGLCC